MESANAGPSNYSTFFRSVSVEPDHCSSLSHLGHRLFRKTYLRLLSSATWAVREDTMLVRRLLGLWLASEGRSCGASEFISSCPRSHIDGEVGLIGSGHRCLFYRRHARRGYAR